MKELEVKRVKHTPGFMDELEVYAFVADEGEYVDSDMVNEYIDRKYGKQSGITREEFHSILDKASQPIEKPKSDSENSET